MKTATTLAATALLLAGLGRRAHADEVTTCEVDAWGDVTCRTSNEPPTGPPTAAGGAAALTVIVALVAVGIATRSDTTDRAHSQEQALGIAVAPEMLANPFILYFDSSPPDPAVKEQWQHKITAIIEAWGTGVRDTDAKAAPGGGGRVTFGRGRVGIDAMGESASDPERYSLASAHLLLRAPPRHRAVFALAVGAGRIAFDGQVRTGLDVSVPHSYIVSHDDTTGAADVSISSRAGFFYSSNGIDVRLDVALVVPVARRIAVEIGVGVFSFDKQMSLKGSAGLGLAL